MIPQKIQCCWLGSRPLGKLEQSCVASWSRACPDYEIVFWNETNSPVNDNDYVKEAYRMKKWAFVSDYVRLRILSEYGGVYLDTDVELLKPLDRFINQAGFIGFESRQNVATCVMGCVPGQPFFSWAAREYDKRVFCTADGNCDCTTNTTWLTDILCRRGLRQNGLTQCVSNITIYPPDVFCPLDLQTGKLRLSEQSAAIHHFAGSWMTPRQRFHTKIAQYIGAENTRKLKKLLRRCE